jgi:hypothetical protein
MASKSTPAQKIKRALTRLQQLKQIKTPWLQHWQLLGEYIHTRKQSFTADQQKGDFLNRELFDSGAPKANKTMASTLVGMLWPPSTKRFELQAPTSIQGDTEVKQYYETITEIVRKALDNDKAGLRTAYDEYMLDQGTFGTSGVEVAEHEELDVVYKAWSVKEMTIGEGKDGMVDTVYLELCFPVHRVVQEYGVAALSKKTKELFEADKLDEDVRILIAIEPRLDRDPTKLGKQDMQFQVLHIEMDNKHMLKEGGFSELPVKVGRMTKLIGEVYGRSPGMDALPDILEANAIWESITIAIEKSLDPPLAVLDDGRLGNQDIDTSAGAINVLNIAGRAGDKPIYPIFTIGDINPASKLLEQLEASISDHFYIDRLLDFNNETAMTLGEVQTRNKMRHATLGSLFSRQLKEVFNPTIERTFNILLKRGKLGVAADSREAKAKMLQGEEVLIIPEKVMKLIKKGLDVYEIVYFTPAVRIMQAEESEGIFRSWQFAQALTATHPMAADVLDEDESIKRFTEISGAPSNIIRSRQQISEIRAERDKAIKDQQEMEQIKAGSEAMRNAGQSGLVPNANQNQPQKGAVLA